MRPISRPRPLLPAQPALNDVSRPDWLRASLIAGFIATFSMTCSIAIAYGIANYYGDAGGNHVERWLQALSHNELTRHIGDRFFVGMILNLLMGIVWAVVYARVAEPHLSGPGWSRGVVFSLLPFILSIALFFPLAGIGLFGSGVDAGILPVAGNLILHLAYGAVLGSLYAIDPYAGLTDAHGESEAAESAERGAVIGILAGVILGFAGGWIVGPSMDGLASRAIIGVAGSLSGAAIGILIGSLLGMKVLPLDTDNDDRSSKTT
ncbi:MAG TPA: DUF6789 family protein [Thermomicrobiales bacterium]|nr:DUF6789 family protein [Thermomicrobiales bacterium]